MNTSTGIAKAHHPQHKIAPASPTFALALGGGGARGLAHIHVIEVMDELGIRPVAIAGSSIGAIMGAGMASGMTGKDIHHYSVETLSNRATFASRIWSVRPTKFSEIFDGSMRFPQFNIEKILTAFLPHFIPATFEELRIPLSVTATDFYGQNEMILESGDLINALAASAALPAVFRPIKRDGRIMIDGGICNPVPFDHLKGKADIVIAVDVIGGPDGDPFQMPSAIDAMFGASQLMMQSILTTKRKFEPPEIFLRPSVSRFKFLDFLRVEAVLKESACVKDELKRAIDKALVFANERNAALGR